jgi:hypothetical protein
MRIFVDYLSNLPFETRPNLLFVLNNELGAVTLILELGDLHLKLAPRLGMLLFLVLHDLLHDELPRLRLVTLGGEPLQRLVCVFFLKSGLNIFIFICHQHFFVEGERLLQVRHLHLHLSVLLLQVVQL